MSTILFNIFNSSTSELPLFSVEIWAEGRLCDFIHARLPSPFEIPKECEQKFIILIYSWKI